MRQKQLPETDPSDRHTTSSTRLARRAEISSAHFMASATPVLVVRLRMSAASPAASSARLVTTERFPEGDGRRRPGGLGFRGAGRELCRPSRGDLVTQAPSGCLLVLRACRKRGLGDELPHRPGCLDGDLGSLLLPLRRGLGSRRRGLGWRCAEGWSRREGLGPLAVAAADG